MRFKLARIRRIQSNVRLNVFSQVFIAKNMHSK